MKKIWKDPSNPTARPILYDFGLGWAVWFISFPAVAAIGELGDLLIYLFFKVEHYEQVAVRFLKMALTEPSVLIIAFLLIVFIAPAIEEFLFRGVLQNYFKRHVGSKAAILLSALCFAAFHFAPSQHAGNIPLLLSLFTFACFLGFLYEKQCSLFAPIGLHMAFNTISALRILILPEG